MSHLLLYPPSKQAEVWFRSDMLLSRRAVGLSNLHTITRVRVISDTFIAIMKTYHRLTRGNRPDGVKNNG